MLIVDYSCADGTPFPVSFATPEDAALRWQLEREHVRGPMSPLSASLGRLGRLGGERAYSEAGLPFPSMWRDRPEANGFPYYVDGMPHPEEMGAMFEGCGRLVQEHASALGIWREHSLPRVRAACTWLQSAPADTALRLLAEKHDYAFHHTMVSSMVTWNDMRLVTDVLGDEYGADASLVALELSQGYENETLRANQRLWRIARVAASEPLIVAALGSPAPELAMNELRAGTHTAFFAALDDFLAEYGWRSETWTIDSPTWREQGDGLWTTLRQLARDDVMAPEQTLARAAERRQALVDAVDDRLAGDAGRRGRFHRRVERLASYVPVREDRALWQLVAVGSLRHALLRRGGELLRADLVDRADDVFFLLPDEVDGPNGDLRAQVARRRAEHERWCAADPPLVVGGNTTAANRAQPAAGRVLRGIPASRGLARGRARVVLDLAEGDRLEPGDVLVCTMTAPPWTPLFAVASAVVTDAGEIGSHSAIAAREYGLPCVVGTEVATKAITDGAEVIVDGSAGTIEIVG